jgi:hypothetical protein
MVSALIGVQCWHGPADAARYGAPLFIADPQEFSTRSPGLGVAAEIARADDGGPSPCASSVGAVPGVGERSSARRSVSWHRCDVISVS